MRRLTVFATLALVAVAAPAASQAPAVRLVTDAMLAEPPPESWLNWRRTRDGSMPSCAGCSRSMRRRGRNRRGEAPCGEPAIAG